MTERKNEARWLNKYQRWQINVQKDGRRKHFIVAKPAPKARLKQKNRLIAGFAEIANNLTSASPNYMSNSWPRKNCSKANPAATCVNTNILAPAIFYQCLVPKKCKT